MEVGLCITGSFCTYAKIKDEIKKLVDIGMNIIPIFSFAAQTTDSRFGKAADFILDVQNITGNKGIFTIPQAEPIGPKDYLDIIVVAPCTGNTLAKLSNGIVDSPVLMACKAHLRNEKPLVISVSTNDALGMNFKNIGMLMNMKNIYFVPFKQDDYVKKPNSLIADVGMIEKTVEAALRGRQLQPLLI